MTSHLEESIMKGTLATSGSAASSVRKRVMAATPSIMPSSMQMSMTLAPFSTCWRATLTASSNLPSLTSLANLGEPATLVRSPIMMNVPCCCRNGCDPERHSGRKSGGTSAGIAHGTLRFVFRLRRRSYLARVHAIERLRDGRDVLRRVAATAAGDVDEAVLGEVAEIARHVRRLKIKPGGRKRIGQSRVGIARRWGRAPSRRDRRGTDTSGPGRASS